MEQALLDSSKYKIHSVSVDSRFADQFNKGTGDFTIRMPTTFKNIQRIALSSVEIPVVEYLFSTTHGNINFTVSVAYPTYTDTQTVSIPEGNYTDLQLVAAVQTALQIVNPDFTCTRSSTTGLVTIENATRSFTLSLVSDNTAIAERPTHWGLGYYLGFRSKAVLNSEGSTPHILTGKTVILVQPTPYYLLQMGCPDQVESIIHCQPGRTSIAAFAKVVLDEDYYVINFDGVHNHMRKEYTFLSPVNISQMRIKLLDPYGCIVDMRSMDWSFTVELYEVVNSRTYAHLGATYER